MAHINARIEAFQARVERDLHDTDKRHRVLAFVGLLFK
jgi:hypothetical protein